MKNRSHALCLMPVLLLAIAAGPALADENYEIQFMIHAIDYLATSVDMSQLFLERGVIHTSDVGAMAQDIVSTQSNQIQTMQTFLMDWYGVQHTPVPQGIELGLTELPANSSFAANEISYMKQLIRLDIVLLQLERYALLDSNIIHEELRSLVQSMVDTQSGQIDQMQGWLCDWYLICE